MSKDVKEKPYVGIVMHKTIISDGLYLFVPSALIEGDIDCDEDDDTTYFFDNADEYCLAEDSYADQLELSNCVAYIKSKEDLMKEYNTNLEEAEKLYYESLLNVTHIGFLNDNTNKIIIESYDFYRELDRINGIDDINDDSTKTKNSTGLKIDTLNVDDLDEFEKGLFNTPFIAVDKTSLEDMIKSNNIEEIKDTLKSLYQDLETATKEMNDSTKANETITNNIKDTFENRYNTMLNAKSVPEIKKLIKNAEDIYSALLVEMDENMKAGFDVDKAENLIFKLSDSYDKLLKLDNLDEIKTGVKYILNREKASVNVLIEAYQKRKDSVEEKPSEHQEKQKELEKAFSESKAENTDDKNDMVKGIKAFLDKRVIGQEEAKRDVISAVAMNKLMDNPENKNSCLLIGPTGSGKTLIVESIGKYFNTPVQMIDTTQLTMPAYVGANIEDFLEQLVDKCGGDVKKAEEAIVVFDEIDKKGSDNNSDVSGRGVLNTLLPFIQGATYNLGVHGYNRGYPFDTKKLTIFATGAFTDVAKNKALEHHIGFNSKTNPNASKEDIKYADLSIEDISKYGNIPVELLGRFSTISQLSGHTKESLKKILTNSDLSALSDEKKKLAKAHINLDWTEDYLDAVADKALELKTGARSLKNTVEKSVKNARWETLYNNGIYDGITLTANTVKDNNDCLLTTKDGNTVNLKDVIAAKDKTALMIADKPKVFVKR
jgi:ATP-dependent Clp protease ATP-binding subunit ClpX